MTESASYKVKDTFQQHYLALRKSEGRIYSDTELLLLPEISHRHSHYREWQLRKESTKRLRNYFQKKRTLLKILEVGCGNGWLAHQLAYIPGSEITGTDVNFAELQQAARVFSHIPNLQFAFGGLEAKEIEGEQFDFIVFASSLQYFESIENTIEQSFEFLKQGGEIHILDTPFYNAGDAEKARKRTDDYYRSTGFPEMSKYYFHHSLARLTTFSPRTLYSASVINRYLFNNKNPFNWISIPGRI
jgi:ubiquinone/menaquinone biosynthesis C-methylase UbiE